MELPVNIKIMYEGMEEFGSDGLFETIQTEAKSGRFLNDVVGRQYLMLFCSSGLDNFLTTLFFRSSQDFFCISDNYWLGKTKPCLTYGLRGLAYFQVAIKGCEQDLHSGKCDTHYGVDLTTVAAS